MYRTFYKYIELSVGISVNEYRYFGNDGETESINLISKDLDTWHEREYTDYINESTNRIEKEKLEENLSFKIYDKGKRKEGLKDLRTLINKHGKYGVYLWDPYLRVKDIIDTLFYCEFKDVPLKALCSAKQNIRQNYTKQTVKKEFEELQEIINSNKENEVIINDIKTKTLTMNSYLNSYGTTEHIQKLKNECDTIESNFKGLIVI